ncbi:hypothetical protein R80B4_01735 [Fibrobacteres bacterium R8-0-B4]
MNFFSFWDGMVDFFSGASSGWVIAFCLIFIFAIVLLSILKLRIINSTLAILASTIVSCLLMIPAISAFNYLAGVKDIAIRKTQIKEQNEKKIQMDEDLRAKKKFVETELRKMDDELKEKKKRMDEELSRKKNLMEKERKIEDLKRAKAVLEKDKAENEAKIAIMTKDIADLKKQISILEHAQLSVQSFERILELALLQTNIKQSLVRLVPTGDTKQNTWKDKAKTLTLADYSNEYALIIINHDIDAKYGVNLNDIKISKIDENSAVVSGIHPKFIGASKNKNDVLIQEIRRTNHKDSILSNDVILNDDRSKEYARVLARKIENEFQQKLSEGAEFAFMDTAVIQLAQNFIKVMFAPLYKNISFEDKDRPNSLPIMEHLRKELADVDKQIKKLNDDDKTLTFDNEKFDTDVDEINKQVEAINKELEKLKKEDSSDDKE